MEIFLLELCVPAWLNRRGSTLNFQLTSLVATVKVDVIY